MRVNVLPGTRFHSTQLIEKLYELNCDVKVYSSSPRKNFRTQAPFSYQFIPQIAVIFERLLKAEMSFLELRQNQIYDRLSNWLMRECDVLHGWAGLSLESGKRIKRNGGLYILERSCPHVLYQEEIIARESEKLKVKYHPKPKWWIERSIQEYEEANYIVTPSDYTQNTLLAKGIPKEKLRRIPLDKMMPLKLPKQKFQKTQLVLGTLVGNPLRKGLIYLLEAWNQLNPPNAKLIIKMNPILLDAFPVLREMISRHSNIEVRGYYPQISNFYQECDLFVLPSVDDGFGLVITEALAHGLPCIATDHVGAVERFRKFPFVKIAKAGDSNHLASLLDHFFENQNEIPVLREKILDYFSNAQNQISSYEQGIENLYRPLVNSTGTKLYQTESLANPS